MHGIYLHGRVLVTVYAELGRALDACDAINRVVGWDVCSVRYVGAQAAA